MLTRLMTFGTKVAQDVFELVAPEQPGLDPERIVTSADTQIAETVVRGGSVLVDVEDLNGMPVVLFVRGFEAPHRVDVERFEAVLAAFRRAGITDLVDKPAEHALRTAFEKQFALRSSAEAWDPREFLIDAFLGRAAERDEAFPTMWWHDDPSAGVDDMAGLLKLHGVSKRFPRKRLIADAEHALTRAHDDDDEDAARDALCVRLCEVANDLLAQSKVGPNVADPDDSVDLQATAGSR